MTHFIYFTLSISKKIDRPFCGKSCDIFSHSPGLDYEVLLFTGHPASDFVKLFGLSRKLLAWLSTCIQSVQKTNWPTRLPSQNSYWPGTEHTGLWPSGQEQKSNPSSRITQSDILQGLIRHWLLLLCEGTDLPWKILLLNALEHSVQKLIFWSGRSIQTITYLTN